MSRSWRNVLVLTSPRQYCLLTWLNSIAVDIFSNVLSIKSRRAFGYGSHIDSLIFIRKSRCRDHVLYGSWNFLKQVQCSIVPHGIQTHKRSEIFKIRSARMAGRGPYRARGKRWRQSAIQSKIISQNMKTGVEQVICGRETPFSIYSTLLKSIAPIKSAPASQ